MSSEVERISYIEINEAAYDSLAEEYTSRIHSKGLYQESASYLANLPLHYLSRDNSAPKTALEIGPGSGEILKEFDSNGIRTIGVEISRELIKIAKGISPNTIFIRGNILDIEFSNSQFDIIYAGALIHLFPKNDAFELLSKIQNWLHPKGIVFVNTTLHDRSEEGFQVKIDYEKRVTRYRRLWTEAEFVQAVSETGFRILEKVYTDEKDRNKKWLGLVMSKA